jgi:hypothetical protein
MRWIVLAVVSVALMVHGQETKSHGNDDKAGAAAKHKDTTDRGGRAVVVVNQQATQGQENTGSKPTSYLHELLLPQNIPNLALVVVGIAGIIVAICTLIVINKQTQALVNSERAMVFVKAFKKPTEQGRAEFHIRARNYGRVPARITMLSYTVVGLKTPDKELVVPPVYSENSLEAEKFVEPKGPLDITVFDPWSSGTIQKWYGAGRSAVIFGKLEYFDGISKVQKETRFAYQHVRTLPSDLGGQVRRCGPREYNLWT